MKRQHSGIMRTTVSAVVAILWLVTRTLAPAQSTDPRPLMDRLHSLALDARVELQLGPPATVPKIFTQAIPDGRSWLSTSQTRWARRLAAMPRNPASKTSGL